MSAHRRSDRSRGSGVDPTQKQDCNCCRVNSAEAETTRPTFATGRVKRSDSSPNLLPGDVWAVDQAADE